MAFTLANLNCIANGPMGNVYTYHTADTVVTPNLVSSGAVYQAYFNSNSASQLGANDRIFVSHTGSGGVSQLINLVFMGVSPTINTACMNV